MSRNALTVLIAAVLLSIAAPSAAQGRYEGSTEARRIHDRGQEAETKAADLKEARPGISEDLYDDALDYYSEAIEVDPDFIDAYVRRGYVHYALGQPEEAAESLRPALKRWPDDPRVQRVLGTVIFDLDGKREEAVRLLESASRTNSAQFDVFYLLGKHHYERKDYAKASRAFRSYLQLKPEDASIHGTLGNIYLKTGKLEPALAEFRLVLQLDPDNIPARINIGNIRFKQGRFATASQTFERVLADDPSQVAVHFNLASSLFQQRRFKEALGHYEAYLERRTQHAASHYMVGLCLIKLKRDFEALESFEEALLIKPDYARAHWHVGMILIRRGELDRAYDQLEIAHHLDDQDAWITATLGDLMRRLGEPKRALELHAQAVASDETVPDFKVSLGRDHFVLGDIEAAVTAFEAAHKLDMGRDDLSKPLSVALIHRARQRVTEDKLEGAEKDADDVLRLGIHPSQAHLVYAAIALERDDLESARRNIGLARDAARAPCEKDCPMAYVRRAEARLALIEGDHKAAQAALTPLIIDGRAPDVGVANDLGRASAGLGEWARALEWFVAARDLGMDKALAERNIALACIKVAGQLGEDGKWRDAVAVLKTSEKLRARLGPAELVALDLAFSNAYAETGAFGRSQRLLARATKALGRLSAQERSQLPNDGELALGLRQAYIFLRLGRFEQATRLAEKLSKGGRGGDAARLLATAQASQALDHFRKGRMKQARATLQKASRTARGDDIVRYNIAVMDYLDGKRGKSGAVFKSMAQSGNPEAVFNYAVFLDDVQNDERAAFNLYRKVAGSGGSRAAEARRIAGAKARVFGFD